MTGFGSARVPVLADGAAFLVVELRATNHKYSEVRVVTPRELGFLAGPCEARLRAQVERGAIDARIATDGEALSRVEVDRERARSAYASLTALAEELSPGSRVPIDALLSLPELFVSAAASHRKELEEAAARAIELALADLALMRATEGAALGRDMAARLGRIAELALVVAARQPEVLAKRRARLLARTAELLRDARETAARIGSGDGPDVAEPARARIEQEIVLLADKYDTTEEKTRLESHIAQCLSVLDAKESTTSGKRLDFLLQEIAREIGTMGAKSEDAEIARVVVEMKTEAAKLREQVQNIV